MDDEKIVFVKLEEKDISDCAEIYFSAFNIKEIVRRYYHTDYYFLKYISDTDKYAYGIRYDGKLVGCMTGIQLPGFINKYTIYVDNVAVLSEYQDKGFGSKMLNCFFETVSGEAVVGLNTYKDTKQYDFYKKLRFKDENIVHLERTYIDLEERIAQLTNELKEIKEKNEIK